MKKLINTEPLGLLFFTALFSFLLGFAMALPWMLFNLQDEMPIIIIVVFGLILNGLLSGAMAALLYFPILLLDKGRQVGLSTIELFRRYQPFVAIPSALLFLFGCWNYWQDLDSFSVQASLYVAILAHVSLTLFVHQLKKS